MNKIFLSLIILSLSISSVSQIKKSVTLVIKYEMIIKGDTPKVILKSLIPHDIENVQIIKDINYSIQPDTIFYNNGNKYAEFILTNPSKNALVNISVNIVLLKSDLSTILKEKTLTTELTSDYLIQEKYIETDHELIKNKALELRKEEQLKTIKKTFAYVNQNIVYNGFNPSCIGAAKALELKRGDCTEFSDLFVALCRSNNIPARVVEGYTIDYGNTLKHNWTEVYVNDHGWVRFDPTPGNSSTFKKTKNRYIQLSTVRNDKILNNGHFYRYQYWGDPIKVNNHIVIMK